MENSKIEWCDATANFWWGCTKVSPGCANCYADSLSHRFGKDIWGPGKPREDHRPGAIKMVEKLNRRAELNHAEWWSRYRHGGPRLPKPRRFRVFVSSMADWLDPEVPIEWLADLLDCVRRCEHVDFLMLTKRPELWEQRVELAADYSWGHEGEQTQEWLADWMTARQVPNNVWIGFSAEDQERLNKRIHYAERIPAAVRFISIEPMLEEIEVWPQYIDWIIVGGESGPKARPFNPDWARGVLAQCRTSNVPFFMKQMGGTRKPFPEIPADLMVREFPLSNAQRQGRGLSAYPARSGSTSGSTTKGKQP